MNIVFLKKNQMLKNILNFITKKIDFTENEPDQVFFSQL